jgi:hypothetical protein
MDPHQASHAPAVKGPELRDANIKYIIVSGVALAALLVAVIVLFVGYFNAEVSALPTAEKTPFSEARPLPPYPRLQQSPWGNLSEFKEAQNKALESYGWVDRQNGVVHLPIERAMELTLQRGVAVRQAGDAPFAGARAANGAPAQGGDARAQAVVPDRPAGEPKKQVQ